MGWPTSSVPDCPAYNVVKQSHHVDPFREHPLENVGCDRDEVSKDCGACQKSVLSKRWLGAKCTQYSELSVIILREPPPSDT